MRRETDSLGERYLEDEYYYGIQTQRAMENFAISGKTGNDYPKLIHALAKIKKAVALANHDIGILDEEIKAAICRAAEDIIQGKLDGQFPVDIFQGGGGTSLNMNMNEVIANRANEILTGNKGYLHIHPNNHINLSQSTNDVIPSAIHIACFFYIEKLLPQLEKLEQVLDCKEKEFEKVVKIARTCLQDAVPITLGQEFSGYKSFLQRNITTIKEIQANCLELTIGGTAVGTGLGTFEGYLENVYKRLSEVLNIPVYKQANLYDGLQNGDFYLKISSALKGLAAFMSKMASDFRLLSSGPRSGLSELSLPSVQPGSSIMPGKINPVMPEMMMQVCFQVYGNDTAVTFAVDRGELDLNVWEPIIIKNLFESFELLINGIDLFCEKCVKGLKANVEVCERNAHTSLALSTVIASIFSYEEASAIAKEAFAENVTIKEIAIQRGILSQADADILLDPITLTDPQISSEVIRNYKNKFKNIKK